MDRHFVNFMIAKFSAWSLKIGDSGLNSSSKLNATRNCRKPVHGGHFIEFNAESRRCNRSIVWQKAPTDHTQLLWMKAMTELSFDLTWPDLLTQPASDSLFRWYVDYLKVTACIPTNPVYEENANKYLAAADRVDVADEWRPVKV